VKSIQFYSKAFQINIILFVLLLLSIWLAYSSLSNLGVDKGSNRPDTPDSFMNEVYFTRFNQQGMVENSFYTPQLVHYPQQNISKLDKPRLNTVGENGLRWIITADHGIAENGGERIFLNDHVIIQRIEKDANKNATLVTSALTSYPKRKYLETNQLVTLTQLGSMITSIGFNADLNSGDITFLSDTHSTYVQQPKS